MKNIITLLAGLIFTASAYANTDMPALQEIFQKDYTIDRFEINPGSEIPATANLGSVEISKNHKEIRLTVYHRAVCPAGAMCPQMMTAPTVITLPIVYLASGICGGTVLVAEQDLRAEDGGMVSLQIVDDNGSTCEGPNGMTRRVQMTLTEQPTHSTETIVSQMSGVPTSL